MRAQDDSSFSDYDYEGDRLTESLISVNTNEGSPQKEQKHALESSAPPLNKETPNGQPGAVESSHRVERSRVRGAVWPVLRSLLQVLVAYLVFVASSGSVPESLSKLPCEHPALAQHFSYCTSKPALPAEEPAVTPEPIIVIPEPLKPIVAPDFVTLMQLQSRLGQVMEDTARSSKVAVDIKDSEMAFRDVRTQVLHSSLSNKDILGLSLKRFVENAKAAGGDLQQFGSRVWGAVDRVVTLNEHTLIMLENTPTEQGLVPDYQEGLDKIWLQGVRLMDQSLRKLIHEAQANVGALQRLEERLDAVEDLISAEKEEINDKEAELRQRWFREKLGLNEEQHQSHSNSLDLLTTVKDDRKNALKHVSEALLKLKQMSNDLDDLREGVATPMLIPGSSNIPIEAHIRSIRTGTERLVNGQVRMREIEDEYRREKFATD